MASRLRSFLLPEGSDTFAWLRALAAHPSEARHDLAGGIVSALVSLPLGAGFGMYAFSALGDAYIAVGAVAGLCTTLYVSLANVLLGDPTRAIYAPRITTTFFLGLLLSDIIHEVAAAIPSPDPAVIVAVLFLTILLAAVFQLLIGLTRLGTLIRLTPHPVMAGFQNAAAILLFLVQLGNVLGFDRNTPFTAVLPHLGSAKPLSVVLAAAIFLAAWNARKLVPGVPAVLVGLVLGVAGYYGLSWLGFAGNLGPVIGTVSPDLAHRALVESFPAGEVVRYAIAGGVHIVAGALALALVASIDALLCSRLLTPPGDRRPDANRLLVRLGIGNMLAGCLGGITGGLNMGATLANRAFRPRTPLSVLVCCAVVLAMLVLPLPIVAGLPRVVLSAIIMVVAVQHLDPWSVRMAKRLPTATPRQRRLILFEMLVVVLVAGLSIAVHIVLAVFIGAALAMLLFVMRMSRSNIRRRYRCDVVHSRKLRPADEMTALERIGRGILVMELDGVLFFGSAERLVDAVEAEVGPETRCLILDLAQVNEVDSTGARILAGIVFAQSRRATRTALAVRPASETAARLADLGQPAPAAAQFEDVDRAIEWAEDLLLQAGRLPRPAGEMPLADVAALRSFGAGEIEAVKACLHRVEYRKAAEIFREGDPGTELFILTSGTASAYLREADGRTIRLATFSPGTVFGELAILDGGPRSATLVADSDLVAQVLTVDEFHRLASRSPAVAIKLLANLGRELSARLRRANHTIHQLES